MIEKERKIKREREVKGDRLSMDSVGEKKFLHSARKKNNKDDT